MPRTLRDLNLYVNREMGRIEFNAGVPCSCAREYLLARAGH